ncbi:hypothetical protein Alg130_00664 [Pyrenophora tritici-repentis]|nr:hypothetical protein Alg130_00664 [Pyrenophora tritici-repentis]KAI0614232.1 extradiol ring-cleavage dioxygenase [Pyrenophora tritici-repentis]KAI1605666.1 hypothetical protein PtrCC142_002149 [Pyrenophora tritici-repentis]PZC99377.1 extradiol ring-cleavage dioxygenase [Pyrenophora tritici-repentis]PZD46628.1 extradiol ring-cleavage dioxygenase [Pyrenophora tritici-repentis]
MPRLAPVISLSHGGGPMPVLGDPSHASITRSLQTKVPQILKLGTPDAPRAIVVVTAHWSTEKARVSSGAKHELLYDYYGFPEESYKIRHDAPGSPERKLTLNPPLAWDHGVFIPLKLIDPTATTPIVQLSVLASESASQHYAIGRALGKLRPHNIAIIGSGFATFHNLKLMFDGTAQTPEFKRLNQEWSRSVGDAALTVDEGERERKFLGWREWTGSWVMHPRGGAEHFLPLIVCAGAAGSTKGKSYADEMMGNDMWSYYWDEQQML